MCLADHKYIYHSNDSNVNVQPYGFSFTTDDVINICYNEATKELKFYKDRTNTCVMKDVQNPPEGEYFVPCVLFEEETESCEIVKPDS